MQLTAIVFALFAVAVAKPVDDKVDYSGYKLLSVGPLRNKAELKVLELLRDDVTGKVQIYEDVITTTKPISMAVSPDKFSRLTKVLKSLNIKYSIVEDDLQKAYDKNMAINRLYEQAYHAKVKRSGKMPAPTYYMPFNDMMSWLSSTANSNGNAARFSIGRSYEGREVYGLSINDGTSLPAVWLDAGIHAREWIAPATALYIIDRILTGSDTDATYLRNNFRWYIVPEVNPDGYEYSRSSNRNWRKNRRPEGGCVGTDPNRNFDSNWGRYGTSTNPCADTYGGSSAFSEPETRNIRDAINSRRSNMNVILSLHSFSQLWLVPWAGTYDKPADYNELYNMGMRAANAIRGVNGLSFRVGTPPDILYAASGGTYDWAKEKAGVKYAYTPELRPESIWQGGFDIPASNILPSGQEIFAGVASICRDSRNK